MTREKKWNRYRKKIDKMSDHSISTRKKAEVDGKKEDVAFLSSASYSFEAIDSSCFGLEKPRRPIYKLIIGNKTFVLIFKLIILVLVLVAFILFWMVWVKGVK